MAGTSQELSCQAFIEAQTYEESKRDLRAEFGITDRELDDALEGLLWALRRDPSANTERVGTRNLWVAVVPGSIPPLRVYLRPDAAEPHRCELLWIEERF